MFETLPNPMNKIKILPLAIALALSGCGSDETTPVDTGSHVASPDWQDQIIYFLMIDRFNDGDSALNDQGQNEFDPTSDKKFSGGDLVGVSDKLSYIEDLGGHIDLDYSASC